MKSNFSLVDRLKTMGNSGWNPIGLEAANEIENQQKEIDKLKAQLINWEKELAPYFKSENDIEVERAIIPKSLFDKLKK